MNYILIERITLNLVSFGWIGTNLTINGYGINNIQDLVMLLVGLSIIFFNVARGIKAYSQRKR